MNKIIINYISIIKYIINFYDNNLQKIQIKKKLIKYILKIFNKKIKEKKIKKIILKKNTKILHITIFLNWFQRQRF